ncbi:MAG: hypothetical protein HYV14_16830 [Elusimicrobia bacterium]|nr:hypothetical protein [Elusimicrobiota bacterium]
MSEWREQRAGSAPWDWDGIKLKALIGVGFVAAVAAWMMFARPEDEAASSRGFNMGAVGGSPAAATGRPFESRPKTSLDMVSAKIGDGPAGVTSSLYRQTPPSDASVSPAAAASPPVTPAAAASQGRPDAPTPPAAPDAAGDAAAMTAAGIPTDARGLSDLGAKEGMLSALAAKMLDHPKILAAVFNNKRVVDAFMSRPRAKENCESGGALKNYLSDPNSGGMNKVFPVIQQALGRPDNASALVSALAGTEMVKRLSACPSLKELSSDSTAITSIAMANPKALGLVMDPRGAAALAANPQATAALASVTSKIAGAK